jgi:hypothetical protein
MSNTAPDIVDRRKYSQPITAATLSWARSAGGQAGTILAGNDSDYTGIFPDTNYTVYTEYAGILSEEEKTRNGMYSVNGIHSVSCLLLFRASSALSRTMAGG